MKDEKGHEDGMKLVVSGNQVALAEVVDGFAVMNSTDFMTAIKVIVRKRGADQLRGVLDALEIISTPSAFSDAEKVKNLTSLAGKYPLSWWLSSRDAELSRQSIIDYWSFFMVMAGVIGFKAGKINEVSQTTNLWQATANLADKMTKSPGVYRHLPPILINNAEQVDRVLAEISDPIAFMEILIGEAMEDMRTAPEFFKAFATFDVNEDGNDAVEKAIASVMIALQKG